MKPTAYRRNARGLRDRQAFEHIRMQAGELFAAGRSQAQVAHQLGVARQNASRWHALWRAGGPDALASRGPTGPDPRLSDAQRGAIGQALRQGARANGFDTDHWTLARITTVIQRLTGTRYHPGHPAGPRGPPGPPPPPPPPWKPAARGGGGAPPPPPPPRGGEGGGLPGGV